MADLELKSDEEKAEELKAWWKANGISVIAGISLAIGGMFAFNYWKQYQLDQAEGASKIFAQMSKAGISDDEKKSVYQKLISQYSGSAYASLGALSIAKTNCDSGKTEQCIEQLRAAINSPQESIIPVAKIRLARVLISTDKLDEASKILAEKLPTSFDSIVTELQGDIYVANKEFQKARSAYEKAILSAGDTNTQLLKLKRDDLGDHLKTGA